MGTHGRQPALTSMAVFASRMKASRAAAMMPHVLTSFSWAPSSRTVGCGQRKGGKTGGGGCGKVVVCKWVFVWWLADLGALLQRPSAPTTAQTQKLNNMPGLHPSSPASRDGLFLGHNKGGHANPGLIDNTQVKKHPPSPGLYVAVTHCCCWPARARAGAVRSP